MYHRDAYTPSATQLRSFGPIGRFDPHKRPTGKPAACPADRKVLYVAESIGTAVTEAFGLATPAGPIKLCNSWYVAKLTPKGTRSLLDMATHWIMRLDAYASIVGARRTVTHAWARAAYEDDVLGKPASGIQYRSAYDFGQCIAFWDKDLGVELVKRSDGALFDFALRHLPADVQLGFGNDLTERGIDVDEIDNAACPLCCDKLRKPGGPDA